MEKNEQDQLWSILAELDTRDTLDVTLYLLDSLNSRGLNPELVVGHWAVRKLERH